MRPGSLQRETLAVSLVLAAAVVAAGGMMGFNGVGPAIGLGLAVGAVNGFIIQLLLERRAPILPTSLLRLAMFTVIAVAAAKLTGWSVWPLAAGIGMAQLVMVGVGVRQGLRV